MRRIYIIYILTIFLSCSKQNSDNKLDNSSTVTSDKDSTIITSVKTDNGETYLTSTYDSPGSDLNRHRASLKELSDSSVFSTIHNRLFLTLNTKHQAYFASHPDFEVLNSTPGNLFQNGKEDNAFVVYDKKYSRISILIYDELKNTYLELFRDLKVKNGLENADCNYGTYGTLDYQFAGELIYQRDYLMKKPESHLEYSRCKIVDISTDEDLVLEGGCFAEGFSADKGTNTFCIPTSAVYNNWECLKYDKIKNDFIIFYGQAFAD